MLLVGCWCFVGVKYGFVGAFALMRLDAVLHLVRLGDVGAVALARPGFLRLCCAKERGPGRAAAPTSGFFGVFLLVVGVVCWCFVGVLLVFRCGFVGAFELMPLRCFASCKMGLGCVGGRVFVPGGWGLHLKAIITEGGAWAALVRPLRLFFHQPPLPGFALGGEAVEVEAFGQ